MNTIRKNWQSKKLGDIAKTITKGSTPTTYGYQYQNQGINFVKVEDIENTRVNHANISKFINKEAHEYLKRSQLEANDILFSIAGTIGKTAFINEEVLPANTNQALAIIRGYTDTLEPKFLLYLLQSQIAYGAIRKARGGAMNNISLGDLKNLLVPYPEIDKQKQIVDKIEELFSVADNTLLTLNNLKGKLKVYRRSVLNSAFNSQKNWKQVKFGDVVNNVTANDKKVKKRSVLPSGKYPVIDQGQELIGGYVNDESKVIKANKPLVIFGDHTRHFKYVDFDFVPGADGVKILEPNEEINPKLLFYFAQAVKFRNRGYSRHWQFLRDANFNLPPIGEQKQIVDGIDRQFSVVDKNYQNIENLTKQIQFLKQSILTKAFSGKLV